MYNNVNVNHPLIHRENTYVSIKKNVSIHSDDRDKSKWPNASEFEVELPQPLKQVQYMKLTDITLPTNLCNISSTYQNNKLLFGYDIDSKTYVKNDLKISYTSGCGTGATVTTVVIASDGSVTSIDVDGGTGYKAGEIIVVTVDGIELGTYTIVAGDIQTPATGDFITSNLTGTMPLNPNNIANGTYNMTTMLRPYIITVPNGLYTPSELASTLETLANIAVVGATYRTDADEAQKIFVKYNIPEKKFYIGNNEDKDFSFFFDERAHKYILSQSNGYGLCPQNNDQYYTKKMWGLGAILGFEKRVYNAAGNTGSLMFNTSINNHNEINSEIGVSSANYSDSLVTKQSKVWLPLTPSGDGKSLSSAILPIMFLPTTIYMEVDKYNNSDELVPHVNNISAFNITHNLKSNDLLKETCNTDGAIDTLSYKRGLDSSNRTNNIKQRNAFATNHIPTGNYGGRINSYFAKLSMPNATNEHYINIPGDDIKTITLFSNQLEERVQKLKVKFRFHDGTLLDFGISDINFTIEFGTVLSDQEKNMKIRNIH